ncbi:hypothetical protein [Halomicronema sp. CCY15110]|uniref:hypothetical protein n=1 Tax=Halomicronema sp. CCY15110 TaxID=2767773 RepID=UPI00195235C5|nr:hypothetical protein [Halomicronema sp. CCY15110]
MQLRYAYWVRPLLALSRIALPATPRMIAGEHYHPLDSEHSWASSSEPPIAIAPSDAINQSPPTGVF